MVERGEAGEDRVEGLGPITAVVCNYEGERYLPACLEAILEQTRAVDEVLVVDNDSQDGSLKLLRRAFPEVGVLEMGSNRGPCPARNAGMRQARNRWVLLVDNDAQLRPDALERLERAALSEPGCVAVQPRSVFASEPERVHYDGGSLHYAGLFSLRNFYAPLEEAQGEGTVAVDGFVSVALLVDRDVLLEAGGFDERYFILFEDLDLSLRLRGRGHVLLSAEDAICLHDTGTEGISYRSGPDYPKRRAFLHSRNRGMVLLENLRWRTLVLAAPGLLLYELVWALFTLRSRTFGSWLSGKIAFLKQAPASLRKRRKVQAARSVPDRELLVGGPLTVAPQLRRPGLATWTLRWLDRELQGWWSLVRRWCG